MSAGAVSGLRVAMMFVTTAGRVDGPDGVLSPFSSRGLASSITERTERSFESPLRVIGTECLRLDGGDEEVIGAGEVERGGVAEGDEIGAHSGDSGENTAPFVPGSQDVILLLVEAGNDTKESSSGVVLVSGLAVEEVAVVMIDKGARILNI